MQNPTTMPERPFDPNVAARLQARTDNRDLWGIEADVRELLRQFAYAKKSRDVLAEDCAAWRGKYEEEHAKLEAALAAFEQLTAKTARPKPAHKVKREYRFPGDAMTGPHDEPQL